VADTPHNLERLKPSAERCQRPFHRTADIPKAIASSLLHALAGAGRRMRSFQVTPLEANPAAVAWAASTSTSEEAIALPTPPPRA
jgi:hypothetical protein